MITERNKQLTVYLSKSLLIPEKELQLVRDFLTSKGFNVTEYKEGSVYSDSLIKNADFVVFLPMTEPTGMSNKMFETFVGKGQFSEATLCYRMNKLSFMIHEILEDDLLVSKIPDKTEIIPKPSTYDIDNWKRRFGKVYSFSITGKPILLYPFIEGYFIMNEYPLTPEEAFKFNPKLLLLL